MMAILLERREYLSVTRLPPQTCSLAMAVGSKIVSECRSQFTSVDSSIVKGPIRLRDPAAKIWPPTRTTRHDTTRHEYESDAKIRPDRRLLGVRT